MLSLGFIISSLVAGLITFLAPCTLPLVPAYLAFISDVDENDIDNKDDPEVAKRARRKIIINGLFFVLGFSLIFIAFGVLAGFLGQALAAWRIWLARIGGAFIIIFGLFMLDIFKLKFLQMEHKMKTPAWMKRGRPWGSFGIGGTFALGWTPCVGPILGSILLLASSSTTALSGGLLLAVFSLGLAIPFLALAFIFSKATSLIERAGKYLKWVSRIGGIFLIGIGILLLTDNFGLTIRYGYELFEFLNYEALLNHL